MGLLSAYGMTVTPFRQHIFDRFYTGKSGNTGIGLAIAKEIITLHGWELNADYSHSELMIGITGIK